MMMISMLLIGPCGYDLTAGLKRPPEILKKIQALTAREKPKQRLMYSSWAGLGP